MNISFTISPPQRNKAELFLPVICSFLVKVTGICVMIFFRQKIIFLFSDAQAAILCSRCDSRKDNYYGECEQYPPGPTPCPENSESMFCSIVREIDSKGKLNYFSHLIITYGKNIYVE